MTCLKQHPLLLQNYLNVLSHVKVFLPSNFQLFASLIPKYLFFFLFPQGTPSSKKTRSLEDQHKMRVEGL